MRIALAPRPSPQHVKAFAAVELGRALLGAAAPIKRQATESNALGAGRRTSCRSLAAYLAVTACNVPQAAAARVLGVHRETVRQMLMAIEDRRDDPEFDALLERATQEMSFA